MKRRRSATPAAGPSPNTRPKDGTCAGIYSLRSRHQAHKLASTVSVVARRFAGEAALAQHERPGRTMCARSPRSPEEMSRTASPSSRRRAISCSISCAWPRRRCRAWAHRGDDDLRLGVASQQASSTCFCWLPPEKLRMGVSAEEVLIRSAADIMFAQFRLLRAAEQAARTVPRLPCSATIRFSRTERIQRQNALVLAVLRAAKARPRPDGLARGCETALRRPPDPPALPRSSARSMPKEQPGRLGALRNRAIRRGRRLRRARSVKSMRLEPSRFPAEALGAREDDSRPAALAARAPAGPAPFAASFRGADFPAEHVCGDELEAREGKRIPSDTSPTNSSLLRRTVIRSVSA